MIKKSLFLILTLCLLVVESPLPVSAGAWPPQAVRVVSPSPDGLVIVWSSARPQPVQLSDGSGAVQMPGFLIDQTPGNPQLPVDSFLIALPPDAAPILDIRIEQTERIPLPGPVATVSGVIPLPNATAPTLVDTAQIPMRNPLPLTLQEVGVARGVRLARLEFHPLRITDEDDMEVIRELRVTLRFGVQTPGLLAAASRDPFLAALASQVVNPGQLIPSRPDRQAAVSPLVIDRTGQAVIEVSAPGLTQVSYTDLANTGFPLAAANPHALHLTRAEVDIPIEWDGDDDAVFEPGERLLFYAQPRFSRWTGSDNYFLSAGGSPATPIGTRGSDLAGKPQGAVWVDRLFEQNTIYTPDCYCSPIPAGRDGDRWVWDLLRQPDRASAQYAFDLPTMDPSTPAQLSLWLIGYTDIPADPDHRVQVKVNNILVGTLEFNGKQAVQADFALPSGLLLSLGNKLTLTLPGVGSLVEGLWLDAFSLRYAAGQNPAGAPLLVSGESVPSNYSLPLVGSTTARVYDVTDPDQPLRLQNTNAAPGQIVFADPPTGLPRRYAVIPSGAAKSPAGVRLAMPLTPASGADMLIVAPREFLPELSRLVSLREGQGLSVVTEDIRAVYDALDGRPTPEALKAYLAHAYAAWSPRPMFVLLVGDGTTDPRHYRSDSTATWIPPYLIDVDPVIGEAPADNQYVSVDGADNLPDMWIGRLPVNSTVETAITIQKIVGYSQNPAPGDWNHNLLLVGDQVDPTAGNFPQEIAALAALYQHSRYIVNPLVYDASTTQAEIHRDIIDSWNRGNGLVLYTGHGSIHQWGSEVLFHLNDLPLLNNGARLPVLLDMTCLTGSFQIPNLPTLDETLLRRSDRGVVAAWGSTGTGLSSGHGMLARGFLDHVIVDPTASLGQAAFQGKLNLIQTAPVMGYLLDTFTLFGDPAMQLDNWRESYLPTVSR